MRATSEPSLIRPPLPSPPTTQFATNIENSNKGPSLQDLLGYFFDISIDDSPLLPSIASFSLKWKDFQKENKEIFCLPKNFKPNKIFWTQFCKNKNMVCWSCRFSWVPCASKFWSWWWNLWNRSPLVYLTPYYDNNQIVKDQFYSLKVWGLKNTRIPKTWPKTSSQSCCLITFLLQEDHPNGLPRGAKEVVLSCSMQLQHLIDVIGKGFIWVDSLKVREPWARTFKWPSLKENPKVKESRELWILPSKGTRKGVCNNME